MNVIKADEDLVVIDGANCCNSFCRSLVISNFALFEAFPLSILADTALALRNVLGLNSPLFVVLFGKMRWGKGWAEALILVPFGGFS